MNTIIKAGTIPEVIKSIADLATFRAKQILGKDTIFKMKTDDAKADALTEFAEELSRVEVEMLPAGTPAVLTPEDWREGRREISLTRNGLLAWSAAMKRYVNERNRKLRGESDEQYESRVAYLRGLEKQITDALDSFGPPPGLKGI